MNFRSLLLPFTLGALVTGAIGQAHRTIEVTASVSPRVPIADENRLELVFTESGKPVNGLKLSSTVGMTNMDMGAAHPPIKEIGSGHYVVRPMFLMAGPWRVTIVSENPKFSVKFDMTVGSKQEWTPKKQIIVVTGAAAPDAADKQPPPAEKPVAKPVQPGRPIAPVPVKPPQAAAYGGHEGHAASHLPALKESSEYNWSEGMDYDRRTGFGRLDPIVRMMFLMMVGGSGMEGMVMAPMKMVFDDSNFSEDAGPRDTKEAVSANIGQSFKVDVKIDKVAVGDNALRVMITTSGGQPAERATVSATVAMTSMDMGTSHPLVKELGGGKYACTAVFNMAGSWRVTLKVALPGMPPATYAYDYEVK